MSTEPILREMTKKRVGLVGFCCDTGLGVVNRSLFQHLPFASWLVLRHPQYGVLCEYLDHRCQECELNGRHSSIREWLSQVDRIFAVENGFIPGLRGMSLARGIEFALMPNVEWLDLGNPGVRLIDRFIAPTEHCYRILDGAGFGSRTELIPHFVDTDIFQFKVRERVDRFVDFSGRGGFEGRKGTASVVELARRCPDLNFMIYSQVPLRIIVPMNVTIHG